MIKDGARPKWAPLGSFLFKWMLTLDSRDTCGKIQLIDRSLFKKKNHKILKYVSKFSDGKNRKRKRKTKNIYLFTNIDIYERKHVRSDPQISRESKSKNYFSPKLS